ncbi:MAG TPA: methyltransferase domain-containing protein [Actinophytocola sp.]|uniref:SAM-dependent methyltransferase n=1 Tax=Actinophytocola sp. TaxID=1872138 RepID=UPI002DBDF60D|nr:methyltransferase domain-containing protein [Actinophytocola sp.]HEU5473553.1 methyltransferase domain-containing protein [Actinophytocola sp.]
MSQRPQHATPVPEEVGRLYDRFTEIGATMLGDNLHFGYWDLEDGDVPLNEAADRLTDMVADRLRVGPGKQVLDVGCGVGGPAARIATRTGAQVTGIAISREQIKRATALAEASGLAGRLRFQHANAMELPFDAESFDGAYLLESIIHMPDREQVLAGVAKALRPGSRVVLTDFFERTPIPDAERPAVDRYCRDFMMTLADLDGYPAMLRRAGLRPVELLDFTEHSVRQTFVQEAAMIDDSRPDLTGEFGDGMVDTFNPADMIDVTSMGELLVVAERPE